MTVQPRAAPVYLNVGQMGWVELGRLPVELDVSHAEKLQLGFSREKLAEILRATADAIAAGNWSPVPDPKYLISLYESAAERLRPIAAQMDGHG